MKKIVQYFDKAEIRALAYTKDLYCLKQSNERDKLDKIQMCKVAPLEINKLLDDPDSIFVTFEKEKE